MEHWAAKANPAPQNESPQSPVSTLSSSYAGFYSRNEPFIREVIESSRTVLRNVLNVLLPDDHLKHAPVRTYFRIISAAMFLLKVIEKRSSLPPSRAETFELLLSHNLSRLLPLAGKRTK